MQQQNSSPKIRCSIDESLAAWLCEYRLPFVRAWMRSEDSAIPMAEMGVSHSLYRDGATSLTSDQDEGRFQFILRGHSLAKVTLQVKQMRMPGVVPIVPNRHSGH